MIFYNLQCKNNIINHADLMVSNKQQNVSHAQTFK